MNINFSLKNLLYNNNEISEITQQLIFKFNKNLLNTSICNFYIDDERYELNDRNSLILNLMKFYNLSSFEFYNFINSYFNSELICNILYILYSLYSVTEVMTSE